jgi:hypothetical protein
MDEAGVPCVTAREAPSLSNGSTPWADRRRSSRLRRGSGPRGGDRQGWACASAQEPVIEPPAEEPVPIDQTPVLDLADREPAPDFHFDQSPLRPRTPALKRL